jgi:hypothetical protein
VKLILFAASLFITGPCFSQPCKDLGNFRKLTVLKFGSSPDTNLVACENRLSTRGYHYFIYDSLGNDCKKSHAGLFTFLKIHFSSLSVQTNEKGEIYLIRLWEFLDSTEKGDITGPKYPEKFTAIYNKLVDLFGSPTNTKEENEPAISKISGATRTLTWNCMYEQLEMKLVYGAESNALNMLSIEMEDRNFMPVPQEVQRTNE